MRIKTKRGCLAALQPTHAEELFELVHHSRGFLHQWLPWLKRIHSPLDIAAFIDKLLRESGLHFVICLEDDTICGGLSFYSFEGDRKMASLGYWLGQDYIGQGIMTDAFTTACDYAFTSANFSSLQIRCPATNESARKMALRLGFSFEQILPNAEWMTDQYVDHAMYSLSRQSFLAHASSNLASVS